jgi:hypothetical protein
MDPNLRIVQNLRVEHQHDDGTWRSFEPIPHDPAAHDGERTWPRRTLFRCTSCDEIVSVTEGPEEEWPEPGRP